MTSTERYGSPGAVEAAIRNAAAKAAKEAPSLSTAERIRMEYFHRFLCRVFSETEQSDWVLKGGTGMLARIASARATKDIDLFNRHNSLEDALEELRHLAATDLGDFFQFVFTGAEKAVGGEEQPYTDGRKVHFDIYIGANKRGNLNVDLVTGSAMTDEPEYLEPSNSLVLPKLHSVPYRLYPVVDQIADKVCATLTVFNGRQSSREKDLVDLVTLATTYDIDGSRLTLAISQEARVRKLNLPGQFELPSSWGAVYSSEAAKVPACSRHLSIEQAQQLMHSFVGTVLVGEARGKSWNRDILDWR